MTEAQALDLLAQILSEARKLIVELVTVGNGETAILINKQFYVWGLEDWEKYRSANATVK